MSPRSKSSNLWLREHHHDVYVKKAQQAGHRARSFYKLEEIAKRYRLFKPEMVVIDLGAAPGGWSKFAAQIIGPKGRILAVDLLSMLPIQGVEFIQGDFTDPEVQNELIQKLPSQHAVDLILSDMAPNITGIDVVDEANALSLAEEVIKFAEKMLQANGALLIKMFQGASFPGFLKQLHAHFKTVRTIKPKASRARSREVFVLANK